MESMRARSIRGVDQGVRDDGHGEAKRDAGERRQGTRPTATMSKAQIAAVVMARRRRKIRIRDKSWAVKPQVATGHKPVQPTQPAVVDQDEMDDDDVDQFNEDEFGMYLVQLYSTLEDTEWEERPELQADIVLVAGLGGHPKETWRAADGTLWPKQLLPEHIQNIRVLSFNYNNTLKGTTSQAGIDEHAEDLLVTLFNAKEDEDAKLRPIVFVGHSLGGLIIKQALYLAERRFDGRYKSLWEAAHGVMFFSTPHYGMDKGLWRRFVRYVLQFDEPSPGAVPTQGMLVEIWHSASTLERISENFEPLQQYLCFQTFVETLPMEGIGEPFVNAKYGRLRAPTEHYQTLEGDHLGVCKFGKEDDGQFLYVWGGIDQLINQTPKSIDRIGRHGKKALYQLCSDEFHSQPLSTKPTPDTCSWVQDRHEFQSWQSDAAAMPNLWISGPTACGKTYLAKYIINQVKERSTASTSTPRDVIHCFITNSIPSHGGLSAVLRSTMHQALRLDPEVIRDYIPQDTQSVDGQHEQIWRDDQVTSLWPKVMAEVAAQHPMTAVIDGFDQLGQDDRQEFFHCLEQFDQNTPKPESLKFLLLSRPFQGANPEESGHNFSRYDMKLEDTGADISRTVDQDLNRVGPHGSIADQTLQSKIGDKIQTLSGGAYLSATLIAGDLRRNRDVNLSEDSILEDLTKLYSSDDGLTGVYNRVIDRVSKTGSIGPLLNQALLWAAFQKEALKPEEFNIAQAVGRAMERDPAGEITGAKLERFLDDNIATTLDFHCGHLVKFQDGRLELVHDSLRAHLIDRFRGEEEPNAKLASICVAYLAMPHFRDSGNPPDPLRMKLWESKVRARVDRHKFARYASLHWHDHINGAGSSWPGAVGERVLRGRELLEDRETGYARCWTEIWWYFAVWPARGFPSDPPIDRKVPPPTPGQTTEVVPSPEAMTPARTATPTSSPTPKQTTAEIIPSPEAKTPARTATPTSPPTEPKHTTELVPPLEARTPARTATPTSSPPTPKQTAEAVPSPEAMTPARAETPTSPLTEPVQVEDDLDVLKLPNPVPIEFPQQQTQAQDETDDLSTAAAVPEQAECIDASSGEEQSKDASGHLSNLDHQEETGPAVVQQQQTSPIPSPVTQAPPRQIGHGEPLPVPVEPVEPFPSSSLPPTQSLSVKGKEPLRHEPTAFGRAPRYEPLSVGSPFSKPEVEESGDEAVAGLQENSGPTGGLIAGGLTEGSVNGSGADSMEGPSSKKKKQNRLRVRWERIEKKIKGAVSNLRKN